jgi:type VI secretion system protein ImpK|tara:strand:- start:6471 stop:7244 length:774 start_codon:yes stop_codon:yes gene_type:complete
VSNLDVIRQFRLFYEAVEQVRQAAFYITLSDIGETEKKEYLVNGEITPAPIDNLLNSLMTSLEERGRDFSTRGGDYGSRLFARVIYVFAAFADDVMLESHWVGRDEWVRAPLEVKLFGSQSAGEEIFNDIDNGLSKYEFGKRDLAKIYLMALNLGFEGKFKGTQSEVDIRRYKVRLFELINDRAPENSEATKSFLGSVYRYNQTGGAPEMMSYLKPWIITISAIGGLYLLGSHLIWEYMIAVLDDQVTATIEQLSLQ